MRLHFFLLPLLFLLASSCRKDTLHWSKADKIESGTTLRLNKIRFINDSIGFVPGGERYQQGIILITRDGGLSWQPRLLKELGKEVYDVAQSPDGTIYTLGLGSRLVYTSDYFTNFNITQLSDDEAYKRIIFRSSQTVFCIGGISFESGVYGDYNFSGSRINRQALKYELNDISLGSSGKGFMAGYGVMLHTADSGRSWSLQDLHNDNFIALDVHSEDTVYTCGTGGSIFKTNDGGTNWQRLRNGNDISLPRYRLSKIMMLDGIHGYCTGDNGLVIYTDDGGVHWSEVDAFTTENLKDIVLAPNGDLLVCGDGGALYRLHR